MSCLSSGIQEWPDGSCYRGRFVSDYRHGYGQHFWPTGEASILSVSALLGQCFFLYILTLRLTCYGDMFDFTLEVLNIYFSDV